MTLKRICLHGPESVGKSGMAVQLAAHYETVFVPEYGRDYCEVHGTHLTSAQLVEIAHTQQAMANAAAPRAGRYLILDTDAVMTAVWSDMMLGIRDPWFATEVDPADLYLLCAIDIPWVDDGTRIYGEPRVRETFFEACRDELVARDLPFATIAGTGYARLKNAIAAIDAHFGKR